MTWSTLSVSAEPALIEAQAQGHAGAVQQYSTVSRTDAGFLTDLLGIQAHNFPHRKDPGGVLRQSLHASFEYLEEFLLRECRLRAAPFRWLFGVGAALVEEGIEVARGILIVVGVGGALTRRLTDLVKDLVLQDPRQPCTNRRVTGEPLGSLHGGEHRFLHDILGLGLVAKLQHRKLEQRRAMSLEFMGFDLRGGLRGFRQLHPLISIGVAT